MVTLQMVKDRLKQLSYNSTDEDDVAILFLIEKEEDSIKNECNITEMPEELSKSAIDRICGEFLQAKFSLGQLELEGLDLEGALKSVTEGDVSVTLDNSLDDTKKLQMLIGRLLTMGKDELICFRKLRW